jgi:branched-chain amino acid transport system substrate-binding protein
MKKVIVWIVIVLVVVGAIVLISRKNPNPNVNNSEPIKIGFIGALSGVGASIGEEERRGAELAVEEINTSGGISGRAIQLVAEDVSLDKMNVAGSVAQKLIEIDKVIAIVGPQWDEPAQAIVPITETAKVPMVSQNITNNVEADKNFGYLFSTWPDNRVGIHSLLKYAQQKKWLNVAIIRPVSAGFWQFASNLFKEYSPQYGVAIVDDIDLGNPLINDFRTPLTKLKAKNPDAIFIVTTDPVQCPLMKQIRELGLKVSVLSTESAANNASLKNCPKDLEANYFSVPRQQAGYQQFAIKFRSKYSADPQYPSAATAYDAVNVILAGLKKSNLEGGEKLRDAIAMTKLVNAATMPTISFDAKGYAITSADTYEMETVREGKFVPAN